LELASIRAFKRLWLALLEAYQSSEVYAPYLHATTKSDQNENQYWNMITATTQAMTAAIAGVNSLHVKPCNGTAADDFTRRIARNVQHLLQSESYFNRVIDPAAGAYYIESLTAALVEKSWQQFCEL
jgi:methylmalonyl-CoA mutase